MWDMTRLFSFERGGYSEVVIHGEIVVHDGRGVIYQTRDALGEYPMRSLLKPFQFLATGINVEPGSDLRYVPCLGSVSASLEQIDQLKKWYSDPRYTHLASKLKLTPNFPYDEESRVYLKNKKELPSPFFHMCFSKHMAILETCEREGWNLEGYHLEAHPYHKKLVEVLTRLLDFSPTTIKTVADGCKLPSVVLNLGEMAKLYQKLAEAVPESGLKTIQQMMLSHPEWIGGPERVDTLLMQKNRGVIAKEGAEGLLGVSVLPNQKYPRGLGIVVKIWAGFYPKLAALALAPLLKELGLNSIEEYSSDHQINYHFTPFKKSNAKIWDISPELSDKIAVWPGDVGFKRKVTLDTAHGDHMTLSSFETTFHVGAHTDAVNHFEKVSKGIESHPLDPYLGEAQVIHLEKDRGSLVEKKDLLTKSIVCRRILIKTGSYPDPHRFNEDFVSLSPTAVEYLGQLGVVLVGIDTPSIDPFSSKDLEAHHATVKAGINILEGINLSQVEEGIYGFSAVPLRIKSADASPVRAILTQR
jgi:arylformamidase